MRKTAIVLAAMISGLNAMAGEVELGSIRAADIPGLAVVEKAAMPGSPFTEAGGMKAAAAGITTYYGRGYSRWQPESQGKAEADLRMYVKALGEKGVTPTDARVVEVEGNLMAAVSYKGGQVLFRTSGSALTVLGARAKMEKEISELVSRNAVVIYAEAYKGRDEWGSSGAYILEYILVPSRVSRGYAGEKAAVTRYRNGAGCEASVEKTANGSIIYLLDGKGQQAIVGLLDDRSGGDIAGFCSPAEAQTYSRSVTLSCNGQSEAGAYSTRGYAVLDLTGGLSAVTVRGEVKRAFGWKTDTDMSCEGLRPAK